MKRNTLRNISAVVLAFILLFTLPISTFAETVQDRVENYLNGVVEDYESAETEEEQASIQEQLSAWLAENGFEDIDLSTITDTDIGQIVSGLVGDSSVMDSLSGVGSLISDAFSSGLDMIMDAVGGGLGTSDGSNTATTEKATSPNVIIADNTTAEASTQAVGVPNIQMPTNATSNTTPTQAPTENATTYNVGTATSPDIVGAGVTTTEPSAGDNINSVVEDSSGSTVAVLIVLSASTLVVIIAMIVFFIMKRKY